MNKNLSVHPTVLKVLLLAVTAPAAIGFLAYLEVHAAASGALGRAPANRTSGSRLALANDKATLIMFAHPQCPCTSASLEELDRLVARNSSAFNLYIVVLNSQKMSNDWNHSALWARASRIPGANVIGDPEGVECKRYGVPTSGTVLLFSKGAKEIFRGGLTTSRGHEGDSVGSDSLRSFFATGYLPVKTTPVFGCALESKTTGSSK